MKTTTLEDLIVERDNLVNNLKYWKEKHEFSEISNDSYYLSYDYAENSKMISLLESVIPAFDKVINHVKIALYEK